MEATTELQLGCGQNNMLWFSLNFFIESPKIAVVK